MSFNVLFSIIILYSPDVTLFNQILFFKYQSIVKLRPSLKSNDGFHPKSVLIFDASIAYLKS